MTSAIQWHDTLQIEVQRRLDTVLITCNETLKDSRKSQLSSEEAARTTNETEMKSSEAAVKPDGPTLARGEAHRQLQKLCPACFGGSQWGRDLDEQVSSYHPIYTINLTLLQRW